MHNFRSLKSLFLIVFILLSSAVIVPAQQTPDYLTAMQLMRQNQYEEAYEILSQLLRRDPGNYPILDQALNALTELKRYPEAIALIESRLRGRYEDIVMATRLGELYHLDDRQQDAYRIWDRTLMANQSSLQAYRYVADAMRSRREFARSIEVYETARRLFNNQSLFFSEITSAHMALGQREAAVSTLIGVLEFAPGNGTFVQRQLISYDDPLVTELAIIELDERSGRADRSTQVYGAYREVQIALLLEAGLYRRALATARSFENDATEGNWPVFNMANRLRAQNQFELADEAFSFYDSRNGHPLQARSMEDRAVLYMTWSRELTERNLDYDGKAEDLYRQADRILEQLINEHPNYQRRVEALSRLVEIALDYYKDSNRAEQKLEQLRSLARAEQHQIIADYLDGRIAMFNRNHAMARVHLTRANRNAGTGDWAERSRYFLALNDFYTGDFEFASIQMRPLERLTTSYYANDALRLRLWMQEGRNDGEPTDELRIFANARILFDTGSLAEAVEVLAPLITADSNRPMQGEALLMAADYLRRVDPTLTWAMLDKAIKQGQSGPQYERLLWERARIADGFLTSGLQPVIDQNEQGRKKTAPLVSWISGCTSEQIFFGVECTPETFLTLDVTEARRQLFTLYEDILFKYPLGFYSDAIRQRLQQLQNEFNL
jgi:tetratricopeptide (TPR) repeat protein